LGPSHGPAADPGRSARTAAGVYARITQRLLAMPAAIWHNWATAEPVRRWLIAYDH
jgi:hypothetical protein